MDNQCYKEVYFHQYCKFCQHEKAEDTDEPCDECTSEPINLNTHRPVKYEAKETKQ